jgi:hypothetical protein
MRKFLTGVFLAATFALGASALLDGTKAAFGTCTYRCICSTPNKCCTTNGVTTCKPDPSAPIQCTQQYDC